MDYVPPMGAIAAAGQKSPDTDPVALAAANVIAPIPPAAFDPRPTYALAPQTADAVLALAGTRQRSVETAEFEVRYGHASRITEAASAAVSAPVVSPEPSKVVSAANRNWTEDVRLDFIPTRKIGTDTVVQYDNPRVMAAWSAAFPDIAGQKFRGLTSADTNVKPDLGRFKAESGLTFLEDDIYLLCNDVNYKIFSESHPRTHINWIAVDNDEIVLFWPKDADRKSRRATDDAEHATDHVDQKD